MTTPDDAGPGEDEPPADDAHEETSPNAWDRRLGLRITGVTPDRVTAELTVTDEHKQAHGIVHGGVHCTIIESVASIGANTRSGVEHAVVGLSNRTNFVRAVRSGLLRATSEPVSDEAGQQTWEVSIVDDRDRLVATGVVTLLQLDRLPSQPAAGSTAVTDLTG